MKTRFSVVLLFFFLFSALSTQYCAPTPTKEQVQEAPKEALVELAAEPQAEPSPEPQAEKKPEPTEEALPEALPEPTTPDAEPTLEPPMPEIIPEMVAEQTLPQPGFGAISGACGELDDTEWNSSNPFFFRNTIDLGTADFDENKLTPGGQKLWKDGNLGGSSVHSEIFAYEILKRCELAKLLKSEAEIKYTDNGGKKTDILVEIDTRKVGVSVTRAFNFPPSEPYTIAKATTLLQKKLSDIPLSSANATAQDAWVRSILSVIAYNKQHADVVEQAYNQLDAQTKSNIILVVTVTDGKDDYIY